MSLCMLTLAAQVRAETETPQRLTLIFEDRLLTLDFRTHPDLLQETPQHYLVIGEQRVPVSFGDALPPSTGVATIETEFSTTINSTALENFFRTTSVVSDNSAKPVTLSLNNNWVSFSGRPTTGHYQIDQPKLQILLNKALQNGDRYVRVPAEKAFAPVAASEELKDRGIEDVIAIGRSNFRGSSPTVFRAAFSAGLPIVDRRNHSYAVPYYKPHGLDATIYLGGQDFRFSNDTPGDMAMQAFVSGSDLYFVFYGQKDGRRVAVEGPFISDYRKAPAPNIIPTDELPVGEMVEAAPAHDGFASQWIRRVWKPGEGPTEEILKSYYRPWAAKIMQGVEPEKLAENEPIIGPAEEAVAAN